MEAIYILTGYLLLLSACEQPVTKAPELKYYDVTQDQFTFLVFRKNAIDSFMQEFEPLKAENSKIRKALLKLSTEKFNSDSMQAHDQKIARFKSNTRSSDTSDFDLALNVIKATYNESTSDYFPASLEYLFFFRCLPEEFRHKWYQTTRGDFRFNATFFALLRDKSEILDKMIYGEIVFRDKKLNPVFGEHIFNEITPEQAKQIKAIIIKDRSFNDPRFKKDRDNFLLFLDKAINGEWRLILTDWN